jgi:hypothetical protein
MKLYHLPASLTMLKLQLSQQGLRVTSVTVPGLEALTAMQQLDIRVQGSGLHGIQPGFVIDMQLCGLTLHGLGSEAVKHLAAAIPQPKRLEKVQLRDEDRSSDAWGMAPLRQLKQYSALLPNSQGLQEYCIRFSGEALPRNCLQYMFAGSGQRRSLTQLQIESSQTSTFILDAPCAQSIASCCPNLQEMLLPSAQLYPSGMRELTSLTRLTIGKLALPPMGLYPSDVAGLAGLQHLHVCSPMPESALVELTALTNLTALRVSVSQGSQKPPFEYCFSEGVRRRLSCWQLHAACVPAA